MRQNILKSLIDLWRQSLILKVVKNDCRGFENDYLQKILMGG